MTDENIEGSRDVSKGKIVALRRRALLASAGAAGAAALAGCVGGGGDEAEATGTTDATGTTGTTDATGTEESGPDGATAGEIGARFGYTATDAKRQPPVEPDHTVGLNIQFTEERSEIPEFFFEPTGLYVEPGDTVKFNFATPHHNVNPYHPALGYNQRVPDGVPPFSSPILTAGDYWLYTFEREGVYDFMCAPHEVFGMVGRIVVGSATGPGANPVGEAPGTERTRPPEFTAGLVLGDEALAPDAVVEQGSVPWADIAGENKRLLLAPVEE